MTIDEEIVKKLPRNLTEKEVLSKGFDIGVSLLFSIHGSKAFKFMQSYFTYDEDFCQDLVSKYFYEEKRAGSVAETE